MCSSKHSGGLGQQRSKKQNLHVYRLYTCTFSTDYTHVHSVSHRCVCIRISRLRPNPRTLSYHWDSYYPYKMKKNRRVFRDTLKLSVTKASDVKPRPTANLVKRQAENLVKRPAIPTILSTRKRAADVVVDPTLTNPRPSNSYKPPKKKTGGGLEWQIRLSMTWLHDVRKLDGNPSKCHVWSPCRVRFRWRCSSEDRYTTILLQDWKSLHKVCGTLLHPPSFVTS